MTHSVEWLTPLPLWDLALEDPGNRRFREPALLRFASDSFMDELKGILEQRSAGLAGRVAQPETWESPAAGWVPASDASLGRILKLFQPAHGRFYLAAASLVCRRAGLPGRKVNAATDRVSLLVRRLAPSHGGPVDPDDPATFAEQAWVGDSKEGTWQAVGPAAGPVDGEERLPLFPLAFTADGKKRQLWAGLVPVAGREIYEAVAPAAAARPPISSTPGDPLADVTDARRAAYLGRIGQGLATLAAPVPALPDSTQAAARDEDMRESLAFLLLDLADFLAAELPDVWTAVTGGPAGLSTQEQEVYDGLGAAFAGSGLWRSALTRAEAWRPALLGTGTAAGPPPVPASFTRNDVRTAAANLVHGGLFQQAVFAALGNPPAAPPKPPGGAPEIPARAARGDEPEGALYRIRFVYERTLCSPYHDPVVSEPTRPFRLASFFDPDAPARPLVIRMPFDTSPRGLRRFPKGVSILMSNKLRQQLERVQNQKLKDLDDGKVGGEPGWTIGMICSLSIPIITICAFFVLMIFLQLLNFVFWWMAFFKICLPIPVRSE